MPIYLEERKIYQLNTAKVDNSLVFANKDGAGKIYLMHFNDLSRQAWQSLMQDIKNHNPNITYMITKMTKKAIR